MTGSFGLNTETDGGSCEGSLLSPATYECYDYYTQERKNLVNLLTFLLHWLTYHHLSSMCSNLPLPSCLHPSLDLVSSTRML